MRHYVLTTSGDIVVSTGGDKFNDFLRIKLPNSMQNFHTLYMNSAN